MYGMHCYELTTITWSTIEAIATAIAAIISAFAVATALRAIASSERLAGENKRLALLIDQQAAERSTNREKRDAAPLAIAIRLEIINAIAFIKTMNEMCDDKPGSIPVILKILAAQRGRVMLSVARESMRHLGCFSEDLGQQIAAAYASASSVHDMLAFEDGDVAEGVAPYVIKSARVFGERADKALRKASQMLAEITDFEFPDAAQVEASLAAADAAAIKPAGV